MLYYEHGDRILNSLVLTYILVWIIFGIWCLHGIISRFLILPVHLGLDYSPSQTHGETIFRNLNKVKSRNQGSAKTKDTSLRSPDSQVIKTSSFSATSQSLHPCGLS